MAAKEKSLLDQSPLTIRNIYLVCVSAIGIALVVNAILSIPLTPIFFLLLLLAIAAQITATSLIGGNITVEVSTAVSMATIALFGPAPAVLIAVAGVTTVSANSLYHNWPGWKGALERIGFNMGMSAIAVFVAGLLFTIVETFGPESFLTPLLAWLLAGIVNDQVNLWLLIGLIHLQSNADPLKIWQENRWAIPINVLVMSAGGWILTFAVEQFDIIGIGIFFLPIVLSAYAFRLYVNQTRKQMENLEELIAERTSDLEFANNELARANAELADLNEELATLSKEKDAFLAVLTHDMRTPLTSIKGYASVLRDRKLPFEQQQHIAKIILRSEENLLEIVNNILEIEKLQSGTPVLLEYDNFDLAHSARSVMETLRAQAKEKEIALKYDSVPSAIMVEADKQKLERVMINLVSNAIKYTPEGGMVTITTAVNGRDAIFSVSDTGYGIPPDELPLIFDRYSRVKKHQQLAIGTGLGLAVVKTLVEAHQGKITVESEVDVGSTFTVRFPIKPGNTKKGPGR